MTDDEADALYLKLLGARERLCVAQALLGDDAEGRALLGEAVCRIDAVGSTLPQWSEHDRDHELPVRPPTKEDRRPRTSDSVGRR